MQSKQVQSKQEKYKGTPEHKGTPKYKGMPRKKGDAQWGCPLGMPNTGSRRLPRENRDQRRMGADSCKVCDDDDR